MICKNFVRGRCADPSCPLVHDLSLYPCQAYFTLGACERLQSCPFFHDDFKSERDIVEFIRENEQALTEVYRTRKETPLGIHFLKYMQSARDRPPGEHFGGPPTVYASPKPHTSQAGLPDPGLLFGGFTKPHALNALARQENNMLLESLKPAAHGPFAQPLQTSPWLLDGHHPHDRYSPVGIVGVPAFISPVERNIFGSAGRTHPPGTTLIDELKKPREPVHPVLPAQLDWNSLDASARLSASNSKDRARPKVAKDPLERIFEKKANPKLPPTEEDLQKKKDLLKAHMHALRNLVSKPNVALAY